MARKKAKPMPAELWVAREPGPMEFLTWDVEPFMPKGETATRYVRADNRVHEAALRELVYAITSDSWATTFQTMGQYRAALLRIAREALASKPEPAR
jgi:hypothetical protein